MPQASPSPHFCGHGVSLNFVQEVGGAEDMAEDGAGQTEELKLRYFHIVFNRTCSYLFHPCERCNEIRCRFLQTEGGFGAGMQQSSTGRLLALFQYAGRQYW